jgi:hypothetical protein
MELSSPGANDAIGRLSKSSSASPGYSRSRTASFPSTAISSLVVMSAESIALPKILADPLAAPFKVSSTSSALSKVSNNGPEPSDFQATEQ